MDRLNQRILIIPGDGPTIKFQVTQNTSAFPYPGVQPFSFSLESGMSFTWLFVVLNNNTDPDSAAIFSITQNSGTLSQGQMWFAVSTGQSSMLTRGVQYYFRAKWIDPGSTPFTAFEGSVYTGV
jgi:hypothetical protein